MSDQSTHLMYNFVYQQHIKIVIKIHPFQIYRQYIFCCKTQQIIIDRESIFVSMLFLHCVQIKSRFISNLHRNYLKNNYCNLDFNIAFNKMYYNIQSALIVLLKVEVIEMSQIRRTINIEFDYSAI